jgi:ABC-type multidrug transport system fused ATPase/permease subunit
MKADFRAAMRVLRPVDKKIIPILAAMGAASVALEVLGLLAVTPLMAFLAGPETASSHASVQIIQRVFHPSTPLQTLLFLFLIVIGVFVLKNVYFAGVQLLNFRFARAGSTWLGRQLLELYFYRSVERGRATPIAQAVRNVKETGTDLYFILVICSVNLIAEVIVILGIGMLLLVVQPYAAVAAGALMSVAVAFQYYLYGHKARDLGAKLTAVSRESYKSILQALEAHKEIRLRGIEQHFIEHVLKQQDAETNYRMKQRLIYSVFAQVNEINMLVAIAIVIAIIIVLSGQIFAAFSTIALFAAAGLRLLPSMNRLIYALGEVQGYGSDIGVLASELEAHEREIPAELSQRELGPLRFDREIRLAGVSYRYPNRDAPAIQDVNLTITRGEFIGIVGHSGAGKSTLTDVLMALVRPAAGHLEVDGADAWANPRGLRAIVGYVPQAVFLMDDTLRRNIAFGERDDAIDDDRIREALTLAQLDGFVARQAAGLATVLGEGGSAVSGGERQRIGIARALYHQPELLVLDEVTSQLDVETEHALSTALSKLKGKKTIVVIAHRLSTVKNCDRVVMMKEGRVIDAAPFHDLAQRNHDFARMVELATMGIL